MPPFTREQLAARRHGERRRHGRTILVILVPLLIVAGVAIGLGTAFGGSSSALAPEPAAAGAAVPKTAPALAARRRPQDIAVASAEGLQLRLPIERAQVTAIAFHAVDNPRVVPLDPGGGLDHHVAPRVGRPGSETATVDIGAPAGSPVYSPVDGTIIAITPYVVFGEVQGYELIVRPSRTAGLLVRMTHLEVPAGGEAPNVGQPVRAGDTQVGEVEDFTVAEQEIARYTSDRGNHVHVEVLRSDVSYTP